MCLGIPGEIFEIREDESDLARVDVAGVRRMVNIGLLEGQDIAVGDWVLIHVGFALSKIDEQEARDAMGFLQSIGQAYDDEIRALSESHIG